MIAWLGLLALSVAGWSLWRWDRPSIPAWQSRNAYRVALWVTLVCLWGVSYKALAWYRELTLLIQSCR